MARQTDPGQSIDEGVGIDPNAVYQALASRRIAYDQMMWQAPALSITAQSFLVTVGVNVDLTLAVRVLALLLAASSGVLSMQLMAKQRFHEQVDSQYLREWEHLSGMMPVGGFTPHDHALTNQPLSKADALGVTAGRWVRQSSYRWWMWGLRLFLIAAVGLLVWVVARA